MKIYIISSTRLSEKTWDFARLTGDTMRQREELRAAIRYYRNSRARLRRRIREYFETVDHQRKLTEDGKVIRVRRRKGCDG